MARDVAETVYEEMNVQIELVVPPDVETPFERRRRSRRAACGEATAPARPRRDEVETLCLIRASSRRGRWC